MSKHLNTLLTSKARELGQTYIIMNELDIKARDARHNLWVTRQRFITDAKAFLALVKEQPDLFKDDKAMQDSITMTRMTLDGYLREDKESPIEKLLAWHTEGESKKNPFILGEVYDLIGKDDARMLKILVRDVVALSDPARAASF